MKIEQVIGKTVTNIYSIEEIEIGGLDTCECFIELDNKTIIDIPYGNNLEVVEKKLNEKAKSIFSNLKDFPVYYLNNEGKSIKELSDNYQKKKKTIINKILKFVLGVDTFIKEYKPYKTEYSENKLKYLRDRKIIDYAFNDDEFEKGFFLLDNGFIITETTMSPHGTGRAGLNYYESISELEALKRIKLSKLTEKNKGSR